MAALKIAWRSHVGKGGRFDASTLRVNTPASLQGWAVINIDPVFLGLILIAPMAPVVMAQQVAGTPGSPDATTTITSSCDGYTTT
jgi:hypothetical protein